MPQHGLGHGVVGDDAIPERAYRRDMSRRASEHALRVLADGEDSVIRLIEGDHRGLPQHDTFTTHENEHRRRSQIYADISSEHG
jgi:hypothetical protein